MDLRPLQKTANQLLMNSQPCTWVLELHVRFRDLPSIWGQRPLGSMLHALCAMQTVNSVSHTLGPFGVRVYVGYGCVYLRVFRCPLKYLLQTHVSVQN